VSPAPNVVAFPKRRRARRKAIAGGGKVLAFTGARRYVYDRDALLQRYKPAMREMLLRALKKVENDE